MEIKIKHDRDKAVEKFKIDLIVWKSIINMPINYHWNSLKQT